MDLISKLIDVDRLKKDILALHDCYNGFSDTYDKACIIGVIDEQPTIESKKGRWIDYSDEGFVECPFCHSATNCDGNKEELHFCFSCGADMRGEQE